MMARETPLIPREDTLKPRTHTADRKPRTTRDEHVVLGVLATAAVALCCCAGCAGAVLQALTGAL